jgi:TolB-like protein/DNA-binding winged helix-turn-helix (wHTH) protein/Tfp pilus assembly protein PilF
MDTETPARERPPFRLGPWRVDPDLCELSDGEHKRHAEPRTMAVLVYLAGRHGVTVSREELLDEVWKTRFVVEESLTRCISQLRQLLDDDPRNPKYLKTVPKLGYRLLVAPEPIPAAAPPAPAPEPVALAPSSPLPAPIRKPLGNVIGRAVLMAGIGALLAGAWWATAFMRGPTGPGSPGQAAELSVLPAPAQSVAILPFVSMSNNPEDAVFADGMTEEVIQLLARVPRLRVPSRTSSFYFRNQDVDLRSIGRQLGVAHVLEGSIRRDRDRLRVTVQLIDVRNDAHIWAEVYDRQLADIFEVQQQIATAIAQKLSDTLRPESVIGHPSATQDLVAYHLYLEARTGSHSLTEQSMRTSADLYKSALERDPKFAAAWAALALTYWILPGFADVDAKEAPELDELAKAAAERALALDATLGAAHFVLGDYEHTRRRTSAAEGHHRRALKMAPGDASLHSGYAAMLAETGRLSESLRHREVAWKLDPLRGSNAFQAARGYLALGRDQDARRLVKLARELRFESASLDHLEAHLEVRARNYDAARALWAKSGDPEEAEVMSAVYRALENPTLAGAARQEIRKLRPWHGLPFRGRLYAACVLGDRTAAREAAAAGIGQGLDASDNWWIPECEPLRTDAAFAGLARNMNFYDYWREYGWPDACEATGKPEFCE